MKTPAFVQAANPAHSIELLGGFADSITAETPQD
jgi:hypothetical protein